MSSVFNTIPKSTKVIIKQAIAHILTSGKGAIYRQEMQGCAHTLYMTGAVIPNIIITADLHMCTLEEVEANHRWPSFKLICTPTAAIYEHWWYQPANDSLFHALDITNFPHIYAKYSCNVIKGRKRKGKASCSARANKPTLPTEITIDSDDDKYIDIHHPSPKAIHFLFTFYCMWIVYHLREDFSGIHPPFTCAFLGSNLWMWLALEQCG
ncbi:hypothetical protein F5I97DRAFT_1833126 [Phlebopus sp. FC_14]|nr:hypothetical protein F5I97DRAFT_1833126 [Phlebopus sp. FC_14]